MKVYFNSLGVVTSTDTTGDSLRQGSTSVTLEAYFDEKNNSDYVATLGFTRHDGTHIYGLSMPLNASNTERYDYAFTDPWFFAKAGETTLTIYLKAADETIQAQGQVTFNIEATDYYDEPEITVDQYNILLAEIRTKASKTTTVNSHALDENIEITKEDVGLGNVDNTSDLNKPISSATQAALDGKVDKVSGSSLVSDTKVSGYDSHVASTSNPHSVTKSQVGLSNVVNTGDSDTPTANGTDKFTTGGAYTLQLQINNLKNIGRFLSIWNASTGVAESNPPTSPYSYKTGDYFRVGTAGTRIPTGSAYTIGGTNYATSQVTLAVGDVVYYDGTNWMIEAKGAGGGDIYDVQLNGVSIVSSGIANLTGVVTFDGDETITGTKTIQDAGLVFKQTGTNDNYLINQKAIYDDASNTEYMRFRFSEGYQDALLTTKGLTNPGRIAFTGDLHGKHVLSVEHTLVTPSNGQFSPNMLNNNPPTTNAATSVSRADFESTYGWLLAKGDLASPYNDSMLLVTIYKKDTTNRDSIWSCVIRKLHKLPAYSNNSVRSYAMSMSSNEDSIDGYPYIELKATSDNNGIKILLFAKTFLKDATPYIVEISEL